MLTSFVYLKHAFKYTANKRSMFEETSYSDRLEIIRRVECFQKSTRKNKYAIIICVDLLCPSASICSLHALCYRCRRVLSEFRPEFVLSCCDFLSMLNLDRLFVCHLNDFLVWTYKRVDFLDFITNLP